MNRRLSRDFYILLKSVQKLSDCQAAVCDWNSEDITKFVIEITPSSGPYRDGKFKFKFDIVELFYPVLPPNIKCITPIYHPNIDTMVRDDNDLISNVCVSILDDWRPVNGLDDCVQAILFLFHQPNTSDSLRMANDDIQEAQFLENVRVSLRGGFVEGCYFKPNYGWTENNDQCEIQNEPRKKKICKVNEKMT